ncbi:hypothetical protein GW17_00008995 [Ensete ventricosum]|nr:hypothetical protein GW17_00008995 [Ensete ventricosum]RZS01860.1 hypothetical protein BHM03_00031797 [Ensete ventricosum]
MDGLEDDDGVEQEEMCNGGPRGVKKRRLSAEQVRALEKNFEVDNKLEPERKVRLAQELGLQPRQVAVWFQNRRARWKTKHLEHDYAALKASYDALRLDYDALRRDNESLVAEVSWLIKRSLSAYKQTNDRLNSLMMLMVAQIKELKTKLTASDKEEAMTSKAEQKAAAPEEPLAKDGSSDSDSSAVLLNDQDSPRGRSSPAWASNIPSAAGIGHGSSSSFPGSPPPLLNLDLRTMKTIGGLNHQNHVMKTEELLDGDEPCSSGLYQVLAGPSPRKGGVVGSRRSPSPTPNIAHGHEIVTRRPKGRGLSRVGSPCHINKRGKAGGKQRDTQGEDGTGDRSYVAQLLVSAKRLPPQATSLLPSSTSSCACLLACFVEIMVSQGTPLWFLPIASKSKIEHVDCKLM